MAEPVSTRVTSTSELLVVCLPPALVERLAGHDRFFSLASRVHLDLPRARRLCQRIQHITREI